MLEITPDDLSILFGMMGYEPHGVQTQFHAAREVFRTSIWGRRTGKTRSGAAEAAACAIMGGQVLTGGPTSDLAVGSFGQIYEHLTRCPEVARLIVDETHARGSQTITLATGGFVKTFSSASKATVGMGWDYILFDEAAKEDDQEVFYGQLLPSLIDREGMIVLTTTPEGDNWVKDLFEKGQNLDPNYWSSRATTYENPHNTKNFIDVMAEGMTELMYEQEILAEFIDNVGSVFRGYSDVATAVWQEGPIPGHVYVLGVDLAKVNDYTVICVFDVTTRSVAHLIRMREVDYTLQEEIIADTSRKWNNAAICIDATNNEGVWEHVSSRCYWTQVYPVKFTNLNKEELVNQFSVAISTQAIQLLERQTGRTNVPAHIVLSREALSEIGSYKYKKLPSGAIQMNAPEGKHDDIVIAHVLAYEMARRAVGGVPIAIPREASRLQQIQRTPNVPATSSRRLSRFRKHL